MTLKKWNAVLCGALMLTACAAPESVQSVRWIKPQNGPQALYRPAQIIPGRLEYAPDRTAFAPVLTERSAYPTQAQANEAYTRLLAASPQGFEYPAAVRLFACKPGAIDPDTARIRRGGDRVVHCATDFLDEQGNILQRETVNFHYSSRRWIMAPVYPPRLPVAWQNRQRSPRDPWGWLPGRSRYQ